MKLQLIKLSGIAVLAVALLGSCRKGESDPFLSLRSRNARITGTWDLSSHHTSSLNTNVTDGFVSVDSVVTSFDGTLYRLRQMELHQAFPIRYKSKF